jgi:hypothetical protein
VGTTGWVALGSLAELIADGDGTATDDDADGPVVAVTSVAAVVPGGAAVAAVSEEPPEHDAKATTHDPMPMSITRCLARKRLWSTERHHRTAGSSRQC